MPNSDFLSVAAVAQLLRKNVRTIHRMIERGELEAIKAHDGIRAPYLIPRAAAEAAATRSVTGSAA